MPKVFQFPKKLKNDADSYNCLIDFYNEWKHYKNEHIVIDLDKTTFIEANLVAFLGAIFDDLTGIKYLNAISLSNVNKKIKTILQKNNFLSYFGYERIEDTFNTTVEYRKIRSDNVTEFILYLNDKLFSMEKFPDIPVPLRRVLISSLAEIFINAGMHTKCDFVYICGQNFPNEHRLDFSIVNLGTTIKENVDKFVNSDNSAYTYSIPANLAIDWAVKPESSTKEYESGGFGLSKTSDFIKKNKGKLCIVSYDGCWLQNNDGSISINTFLNKFNGTMVNFEINMSDSYAYDII